MNFSSVIGLLKCVRCEYEYFVSHPFDSAPECLEGIAVCSACGHYYPLEKGILDCRPDDLIPISERLSFEKKYSKNFRDLKITPYQPQSSVRSSDEKFIFEDSKPEDYEQKVVSTCFWNRILSHALKIWEPALTKLKDKSLFLDIGCGTGRLTHELAKKNFQVIGIDVAYPLLKIANQKKEFLPLDKRPFFIVADIWNLPFKTQTFDGLSFFGVLHHLESPYKALAHLLHYLKEEASILGVDNNRSWFRGFFDTLMKMNTLWEEDQNLPHAQINGHQIAEELQRFGFKTNLKSLCFIPPHLYSSLPVSFADAIYQILHSVGSCLPFLSHQGGLLCLSAHRSAPLNQNGNMVRPHPLSSPEEKIELSVVILGYQTGERLREFVAKTMTLLKKNLSRWEIILVGNYWPNSEDDTPNIVRDIASTDLRIRTLTLPKEGHMGWDARMGLELTKGGLICLIDGDEQMPPEDIIRVYHRLKRYHLDFVLTYRKKRYDGLLRLINSRFYNWITRILFPGLNVRDINSKPKIFTRAAYQQMNLTSNDWFLDAEIVLCSHFLKLKTNEIPTAFYKLALRKSYVKLDAIIEFTKNLLLARIKSFFRS